MSLAGSKVGMRHLCVVERDSNSAISDSWGNPSTPSWVPLSTIPCSAWVSSAREALSNARSVIVEDRKISVPLGTDVHEGDRVSKVTTESGATYFDGPMGISSVLRHGDHVELSVERLR